jgi:pyridoxal phosphate enzyme (YggS family)
MLSIQLEIVRLDRNQLFAGLRKHGLVAGREKALDGLANFIHSDTVPWGGKQSRFAKGPGKRLRYPSNRPVLQEKIEQVEARIANAAARAGRRRSDITLLAVTKKFPAGVIREAYQLGLRDFGENYVQEFEDKRIELAGCDGARYHLIGHLQSNKSKKAAEIFEVIQTVDTAKLARRLDEEQRKLDVMIEVKLSTEEAKAGAAPEDVPALVDAIRGSANLRLLGLMTMPPWSEVAEQSRPYFARLRALAEANGLPQLSMGMSHDLEVAIEEGSTMVRVGTALFGPRRKA